MSGIARAPRRSESRGVGGQSGSGSWRLFWSGTVLENETMWLVGFSDALLFVSGHPVGKSPCPCRQKIGSVGRLCCEAICTFPAATRRT